MKKAKGFGNAVSIIASLVPVPARLSVLAWLTRRRYHAPGLVFPFVFSTPAKLLFIMPEDPLAALHQISGCCALASHFKNAHLTVLCRRLITPFFRTLAAVKDFIEYDTKDRYPFSKEFARIGTAVSGEQYDVCVLFDPEPDISLLYLCGQSAAAVRIGFAGAGSHPFLNMQVRPSAKRAYCTDQGLLLASVLGAPLQKKTQWTVAKDAIAEVNFLLGELKVDAHSHLTGLDAGYFLHAFGERWTQSLIERMKKFRRAWYLFSFEEPDEATAEWLGSHGLPVFSNLPASRCAALVNKSEFIVAGASVLFELADVLRRPVIGILSDTQSVRYFRETETTGEIRYADAKRPDESVIDAIERRIADFRPRPSDVP